MRYYGGKSIVGKRIYDFLKQYIENDYIYIEPFCGALGILKHMSSHFKKCYANDQSKDLIMLLNQVKLGQFKNPKITRDKWLKYKYSNKSCAERAFAGYGCSFGGVWFNGYIDDPGNNDMTYSSLLKLEPLIKNVKFYNKDYIDFLQNFDFSKGKYFIYLDPPYKNTSCQPWPEFDSQKFWNVVRYLCNQGCLVFVSEFSAPKDFKSIFSFSRKNGLHNVSIGQTLIEKIFVYKKFKHC